MAFSIMKTVIRFGVIGGLVVGGAALIAGPQRVAAVAEQAKQTITSAIDENIDDPIAMRAQLRDLESQYPKRIAEVRSHLSDVEAQIAEVEREREVSSRVVSLARSDYQQLSDLIARAEEARSEHGAARLVKVAFDDRTLHLSDAYSRANNIRETVNIYENAVSDYNHELESLTADAEQLRGLLAKLENEHTEFQSQLAHLERQIDSVARKESMVEVFEQREKRFNELSRYQVASLDQFRAKLEKKSAELDARMASVTRKTERDNYEDKAKIQLDRERSAQSRSEILRNLDEDEQPAKDVIRIEPETSESKSGGSVAMRLPLVID